MTDMIDTILADPLSAARAAPRAIGCVGFDVPIDLLLAPPIHSAHLPWRTGKSFPVADRWLESGFPQWSRAILEDWAAGQFDFMEAVIFTRGDDAAQRLYYYICELQRRGDIAGPQPLIFDVARINRPTSVARTSYSVRHLAQLLGLTDADLADGIARANARRATFEAWEAARGSDGAAHARRARASLYAPINELPDTAATPTPQPERRILLAGSVPPDERIHRAVEASGFSITGEAHDLSLLRHGPAVSTSGDPAEAIGRQAQALPIGARSFATRGPVVVEAAARARAQAVILWYVEEDEAQVWQIPSQTQALAQHNIPTLVLTRRSWSGEDGTAEQIQTFLKDLPQ